MLRNLSGREIAGTIWLTIVLLWALFNKTVRSGMLGLIGAFFTGWKISAIFSLMIAYFLVVIFVLKLVGFWEVSLLKDTLLWLVIGGTGTIFSAFKVQKEDSFFAKYLKKNIELMLIIEFLVNVNSFHWGIELFLCPIVTLMVLLIDWPHKDPKTTKSLKSCLKPVLVCVGFTMLTYSVVRLCKSYETFEVTRSLKGFLLPLILMIAGIPYMLFLALIAAYEVCFLRIEIRNDDQRIRKFLKWKTILLCGFNVRKIILWQSKVICFNGMSEEDIANYISNFEGTNKKMSKEINRK